MEQNFLYFLEVIVDDLLITKPNKYAPEEFPLCVEIAFRDKVYISICDKESYDNSNCPSDIRKKGKSAFFALEEPINPANDQLTVTVNKKCNEHCKFFIGSAQVAVESLFQKPVREFLERNPFSAFLQNAFSECRRFYSQQDEKDKNKNEEEDENENEMDEESDKESEYAEAQENPISQNEKKDDKCKRALEAQQKMKGANKTKKPIFALNLEAAGEAVECREKFNPTFETVKKLITFYDQNDEQSGNVSLLFRLTCLGPQLVQDLPPNSRKPLKDPNDMKSLVPKAKIRMCQTGTSPTRIQSGDSRSPVKMRERAPKVVVNRLHGGGCPYNNNLNLIKHKSNPRKKKKGTQKKQSETCETNDCNDDEVCNDSKCFFIKCCKNEEENTKPEKKCERPLPYKGPVPCCLPCNCIACRRLCCSDPSRCIFEKEEKPVEPFKPKRNPMGCKPTNCKAQYCYAIDELQTDRCKCQQFYKEAYDLEPNPDTCKQTIPPIKTTLCGHNKAETGTCPMHEAANSNNNMNENNNIDGFRCCIPKFHENDSPDSCEPSICSCCCDCGITPAFVTPTPAKPSPECYALYEANFNSSGLTIKVLRETHCVKDVEDSDDENKIPEDNCSNPCGFIKKKKYKTGAPLNTEIYQPHIKGSFKYSSAKESLPFDMEVPVQTLGREDKVKKYEAAEESNKKNCCVQVDPYHLDHLMKGMYVDKPLGIEVCKKVIYDQDIDQFILNLGVKKKCREKRPQIIVELRTPKPPEEPNFHKVTQYTQVRPDDIVVKCKKCPKKNKKKD